MISILVTGGIGSGKSAVCRILQENGVPVYYSDDRAKALYDTDRALVEAISSEFGQGMILADGTLDRKALGALVFGDRDKLARLESIVHPHVLEDFVNWRKAQKSDMVAFESAIAMRLPAFMAQMDRILLVDAELDLRVSRASQRDGADREAIYKRASAQRFENEAGLPLHKIDNNGTPDELRSEVLNWIEKLKKENNMKTDLGRVLSVSGQHGLFYYLAQARNGAIAESLSDKKRTVFDLKARISTLADIAIYTSEGELRLAEVFTKMHEVLGENDAPTSKAPADQIKALFEQAIPNYDSDRFYISHMKKVVDWYNELKNFASLDFVEEGEQAEEETEE